jgi:hypothetical protein
MTVKRLRNPQVFFQVFWPQYMRNVPSCVCVCCHVNTEFFNTVNKAKTACACGTKSSSVRIFAWTHTEAKALRRFDCIYSHRHTQNEVHARALKTT